MHVLHSTCVVLKLQIGNSLCLSILVVHILVLFSISVNCSLLHSQSLYSMTDKELINLQTVFLYMYFVLVLFSISACCMHGTF